MQFKPTLIIIHLIATFFCILALRQFAVLIDIEIVELIHLYGINKGMELLMESDTKSHRLGYFIVFVQMSPLIGLLLATFISFCITIKQKAAWINSLIVFLIGLVVIYTGFFKLDFILQISDFVGGLLVPDDLFLFYLVNGIFLMGISFLVFFVPIRLRRVS